MKRATTRRFAVRVPRGRRLAVPRMLDRRLALVTVAGAALVAGLGAGAAGDRVPEAAPEPVAATPEQCAAAQVAWTESAARQVTMDAEDPATLRAGFVGASRALADVAPPAAVAADWTAVRSFFDTVAQAVAPVDPADADGIVAAVDTALAGLDTGAVTAASARVTQFLHTDCAG
ncbi:hypothetical protein ET495_14685 [Xylanimonas allomyrinae]|uniref:Uncharacterized protein n=1 Tax=Xylanimonas allomyrinae TaxID=2509459 RepID=A0A4P6EUW3_9MICO|nr:hypothetical protein [Xylanimonas allomyrinae]QAY64247.1 hypothetical protein ET495_14685 [Xylanimonas allomyrinae]